LIYITYFFIPHKKKTFMRKFNNEIMQRIKVIWLPPIICIKETYCFILATFYTNISCYRDTRVSLMNDFNMIIYKFFCYLSRLICRTIIHNNYFINKFSFLIYNRL